MTYRRGRVLRQRLKTRAFAANLYYRNLKTVLTLPRDRRPRGARSRRKRSSMSPNSHNNNKRSPDAASAVEEADKEVARSAARHRHHPVVKTLGTASEIADQIPLSIVCAAMIGTGAITPSSIYDAGRPQDDDRSCSCKLCQTDHQEQFQADTPESHDRRADL